MSAEARFTMHLEHDGKKFHELTVEEKRARGVKETDRYFALPDRQNFDIVLTNNDDVDADATTTAETEKKIGLYRVCKRSKLVIKRALNDNREFVAIAEKTSAGTGAVVGRVENGIIQCDVVFEKIEVQQGKDFVEALKKERAEREKWYSQQLDSIISKGERLESLVESDRITNARNYSQSGQETISAETMQRLQNQSATFNRLSQALKVPNGTRIEAKLESQSRKMKIQRGRDMKLESGTLKPIGNDVKATNPPAQSPGNGAAVPEAPQGVLFGAAGTGFGAAGDGAAGFGAAGAGAAGFGAAGADAVGFMAAGTEAPRGVLLGAAGTGFGAAGDGAVGFGAAGAGAAGFGAAGADAVGFGAAGAGWGAAGAVANGPLRGAVLFGLGSLETDLGTAPLPLMASGFEAAGVGLGAPVPVFGALGGPGPGPALNVAGGFHDTRLVSDTRSVPAAFGAPNDRANGFAAFGFGAAGVGLGAAQNAPAGFFGFGAAGVGLGAAQDAPAGFGAAGIGLGAAGVGFGDTSVGAFGASGQEILQYQHQLQQEQQLRLLESQRQPPQQPNHPEQMPANAHYVAATIGFGKQIVQDFHDVAAITEIDQAKTMHLVIRILCGTNQLPLVQPKPDQNLVALAALPMRIDDG
jgi:hypothetical protein